MSDRDDMDMCPNCVTPWECNGPHINDQTPRVLRIGGVTRQSVSLDGVADRSAAEALSTTTRIAITRDVTDPEGWSYRIDRSDGTLTDTGLFDSLPEAVEDLLRWYPALDRERAAALPTLEVERLRAALERLLRQQSRGGQGLGFNADMHEEAVVGAILNDPEVRAAIAQEGSPVGLDLRAAFIEALVGAWEQAHYIAARLPNENGVGLVSNIEAAFGPLIPDWQDASAEAARRATLSDDVSPEPEDGS